MQHYVRVCGARYGQQLRASCSDVKRLQVGVARPPCGMAGCQTQRRTAVVSWCLSSFYPYMYPYSRFRVRWCKGRPGCRAYVAGVDRHGVPKHQGAVSSTRKDCRQSLLCSQIAGTRRVLWLASSRALSRSSTTRASDNLVDRYFRVGGYSTSSLLVFEPAERPAEGSRLNWVAQFLLPTFIKPTPHEKRCWRELAAPRHLQSHTPRPYKQLLPRWDRVSRRTSTA